jgi:ornithine cyclodeaminase/alanine dehydrogenase-like protein (mu-crystallin family)
MNAVRYLDAAAVTAALPPADAVAAITAALTAGFDPATDTPRISTPTSRGHFLLMPSEVGRYAGVKVATVAPDNPRAGLPRIQGSYLLFDADTLALRAVLDGTALTAIRTPAVSGAAVRPALDRLPAPARIAVFGAGPQATGHVATLAAILTRPPEAVTFITRRPEHTTAARPHGDVVAAGTPAAAAALAAAGIVVCATSARTPLFTADAAPDAAVFIAVGSHEPDARELPGPLLTTASILVEDPATALREAGDIILARDENQLTESALIPMAAVVTGRHILPADRPVVFKSVGMSWQDLVIATAITTAALPAS